MEGQNGSTLVTRQQAAALLGLRPQTLAAWASSKQYSLPFVRVGKKVRYRVCDLERFLSERSVNMPEPFRIDSVLGAESETSGAAKSPKPSRTVSLDDQFSKLRRLIARTLREIADVLEEPTR